MRIASFALSILLGLAAGAAAQGDDLDIPEDLQDFWRRYAEAKRADDEDEMDKEVRRRKGEAETVLNLLLDDLSRKDESSLHHEARTLAWSLDRVEGGGEKYIERVRLVLDLSMRDRRHRAETLAMWDEAIALKAQARKDRTVEGWDGAIAAFEECFSRFEHVGDAEFAVYCMLECADMEGDRGRPWEQAVFLKRAVDAGEDLRWRMDQLASARLALDKLLAAGIDPAKEKPDDLGTTEPADAPKGRGLTSYAPGSEEQVFELEFQAPRKGITRVTLPTFHPLEQYLLWPYTYIEEEGPADFDTQRIVPLTPHGRRWILTRDGVESFGIDSDGDGTPDVTFSPSSTPMRIEVPDPKDGPAYPLMVATPSRREPIFDIEANYAPQPAAARLRFHIASWYEGRVLGTTWKLYDSNMDGVLDGPVENFDDLVTWYDDDGNVSYWEPDAVVIGRSDVAAPLSTVMNVDGGFHHVQVDPGGSQVSLRELAIETGFVEVDIDLEEDPVQLIVREVGGKLEGALFDILPPRRGRPVELPVGTYQVCFGRIEDGKRTSMDHVRIYTGESEPFEVGAGETVELEFGAPFRLTFETERVNEGVKLVTRSLRIFGRGGEEYAMLFDVPLQPELAVRDGDGHTIDDGIRLRKAGIGEWQENTGPDNILWFPLAYTVEAEPGDVIEMKLTQKSHPLLGGPFESEWIR